MKTDLGIFDGNKWEELCQVYFKKKYIDEHYFEMIASPGDYGIEGFTRAGKAFQCYCPDDNYSAKVLYEKQRDKITKDLGKLKKYETQLKLKLGQTLIETWYFVSPAFSKNEIIDHCTIKKEEVKSWNLSIIDNTKFEVVPMDIDHLKPEILTFLKIQDEKLQLSIVGNTSDNEMQKWKSNENILVNNAKAKHKKRFPINTSNLPERVNKLTTKTITHFLNGNQMIKNLQNNYPDDYEKFMRVVSQIEEEIEEQCMFPSNDNNAKYESFKKLLNETITKEFSFWGSAMITDLCNQVIADWILRCPINFD